MNAGEIEQAITDLAAQPFDPAEFPYAFLQAFGNKATTLKRLRAGASNKSDLGGVLQTSNIHILTCEAGQVTQALAALKVNRAGNPRRLVDVSHGRPSGGHLGRLVRRPLP